jgi:hypothetical protein
MGFTRVIDWTAPVVEVQFKRETDHLAAWVRVERKPGVWAKQSLAPPRDQPDGDWLLVGEHAEWQDFDGNKLPVPGKLMERPGLDPQLKRIGPILARLRYFVEHSAVNSSGRAAITELLTTIDHVGFRARSRRGAKTLGRTDDQATYRDRKRKGRTPASARFGEEPVLACLRRSAQPDSDMLLILC